MKFGVAEVARIFSVDRNVVKTWAFAFSDYLTSQANPTKGEVRYFSIEDIRVFGYVIMYWENEPDIEAIKYGLNANGQNEEIIDELIRSATPIFREVPEGIDELWSGTVVINSLAEKVDSFNLAESYRLSGDTLAQSCVENGNEYQLIFPIIYNYRHATELYLKSIVHLRNDTHDLKLLLTKLKELLTTRFNSIPPPWFENVILAFDDFDPGGTTFRYGGDLHFEEAFVDVPHLKFMMRSLASSFQKIINYRDGQS